MKFELNYKLRFNADTLSSAIATKKYLCAVVDDFVNDLSFDPQIHEVVPYSPSLKRNLNLLMEVHEDEN